MARVQAVLDRGGVFDRGGALGGGVSLGPDGVLGAGEWSDAPTRPWYASTERRTRPLDVPATVVGDPDREERSGWDRAT
ncbi:hypothetical protein [Streptomyces sp. SID3343]|uniref:hypothetical protein n=1 Tax=Streptomyces sp. SID3343 TaxID=2690260 RepID=UPI00136E54D4|nr:hypothetical protein [Streptomyces sp. SID3343]